MRILVTIPVGEVRERFFPQEMRDRIEALGTVTWNPYTRQYTREELTRLLGETEVVYTHWGVCRMDPDMLRQAPGLRLIAHGAGTVVSVITEDCFDLGIPVISANRTMAEYVAEGALTCILAGLHQVSWYDRMMRAGIWDKDLKNCRCLLGGTIGLLGLGTVGRFLLRMLAPLRCRVLVYDPYIPKDALQAYPNAEHASFEQVMSCPVVSIHASLTDQTRYMVDRHALSLMPDGALLVNTARGGIVDTGALAAEMRTGRIRAVLDVFEHEGKPDPTLSDNPRTILQPHVGAACVGPEMTAAVLEEIGRFSRGEPLTDPITREVYRQGEPGRVSMVP